MEVWVNAQIYPMSLRYVSSLFSHNINKWPHGVFLLIVILTNVHINIYRILPRCLPRQNDHVWADLRMLRHTSDQWQRVQMCPRLYAKCNENAAFRDAFSQTRSFLPKQEFFTLSPFSIQPPPWALLTMTAQAQPEFSGLCALLCRCLQVWHTQGRRV